MARTRRRDDDSEEYEPLPAKKRKKGLPVWAVVLIVAVPLVVITTAVGGFLLLRSAVKSSEAKVMTREAFKQAVMDKTPDEVKQSVGVPDDTNEFGSATGWIYRRKTKDPVTGKTDTSCCVTFQDGKVISVTF